MQYNLKLKSKKDNAGRYFIDSVYEGTKTDPKDTVLYSGDTRVGSYERFLGEDMKDWVWNGSNILLAFDPMKAKADLAIAFGNNLIKYAPYWSILSDMIVFSNFVGIKNYMGGLLQMNILTQDDYKAFVEVFNKQGIKI